MSNADELIFRAFTRQTFPTPSSAVPVLECFTNAGVPFSPTHYGSHEPIRTPFNMLDLVTPAKVLSERPRELFLKRSRPPFIASLSWKTGRDRPWIWSIRFGASWIHPRTCGPSRLMDFLMRLCSQFPPVFAACATNDDWSLKHTIRDPATHEDRGMKGMILNPSEGLPGVYWLTFFGPELVSFFGRERLTQLNAHRIFDLQNSGIGFSVYKHPTERTPECRREREAIIVSALGAEYFFDLAKASRRRPRRRVPIPRVTDHR